MIPVLAGALAGALHVVTGPDHIAAVAPLAIREPSRAARTGAAWGIGHASGVLALGGLGIAARQAINLDALSAWAEFLVGAVLVGLGLWAFRQSRAVIVHSHPHDHDSHDHDHVHVHIAQPAHPPASHAHHMHTAFGVGMLHGAAGAGHLLGVVPSLALPPTQAALYLAAYGVSAVASMTFVGLTLGMLGRRLSPSLLRGAMVAAGVVAVGLGGFWMISGWPSS